jgi:hypothetical protein
VYSRQGTGGAKGCIAAIHLCSKQVPYIACVTRWCRERATSAGWKKTGTGQVMLPSAARLTPQTDNPYAAATATCQATPNLVSLVAL